MWPEASTRSMAAVVAMVVGLELACQWAAMAEECPLAATQRATRNRSTPFLLLLPLFPPSLSPLYSVSVKEATKKVAEVSIIAALKQLTSSHQQQQQQQPVTRLKLFLVVFCYYYYCIKSSLSPQ